MKTKTSSALIAQNPIFLAFIILEVAVSPLAVNSAPKRFIIPSGSELDVCGFAPNPRNYLEGRQRIYGSGGAYQTDLDNWLRCGRNYRSRKQQEAIQRRQEEQRMQEQSAPGIPGPVPPQRAMPDRGQAGPYSAASGGASVPGNCSLSVAQMAAASRGQVVRVRGMNCLSVINATQ